MVGLVVYLLQPHGPPLADRLRYRPPGPEQFVSGGAGAALPRTGRTYVPAYSHAYVASGTPVLFAVTLSIRNVDPERPLRLRSVDYHATAGDRVRSFLTEPALLPPLGTVEYFVEQNDEAGGSGANFIVEWATDERGHPPLVEAVMLGTSGASRYSFVSRGVDLSGDAAPSEPSHPDDGSL